jgi:hypothetical protein
MLQEADSQDGFAREHCSIQTVNRTIPSGLFLRLLGQTQTGLLLASDLLVCGDGHFVHVSLGGLN